MSTGGEKKKNQQAAKEKHKDKEEVNRRDRWGAAAQEQLQLMGCLNNFQRMDKL